MVTFAIISGIASIIGLLVSVFVLLNTFSLDKYVRSEELERNLQKDSPDLVKNLNVELDLMIEDELYDETLKKNIRKLCIFLGRYDYILLREQKRYKKNILESLDKEEDQRKIVSNYLGKLVATLTSEPNKVNDKGERLWIKVWGLYKT